uniref:Tetrahydrofolate dehydrogenase/cyclohydrolase NAD(P)-binding domain-containing protein n=1 Tax=Phlebotomus papatasi TaxID=29031 RepID=A0A1B0GPZ9_PHLPP
MVFFMSMATVMGPTPPGTGVMCPATFRTSSKSTSPTRRVFPVMSSLILVIPTSMTHAPGFTISARMSPGTPVALTMMSALLQKRASSFLVQLPLPHHIHERRICNAVSCDKDVDGFNEKNVGRLCLDMNTLIPCTPLGVQELLKRTGIETFGKNAVVAGRSKNVGMPISMLLHADGRNDTDAMDATVTICHRFTPPVFLFLWKNSLEDFT